MHFADALMIEAAGLITSVGTNCSVIAASRVLRVVKLEIAK